MLLELRVQTQLPGTTRRPPVKVGKLLLRSGTAHLVAGQQRDTRRQLQVHAVCQPQGSGQVGTRQIHHHSAAPAQMCTWHMEGLSG